LKNDTATSSDLTLRQLARILSRRRTTIFISVALGVALSVSASILMTRRFQATCLVQLQKSGADALNLDSLTGAAGGGGGDALTANIDLQTQSQILQSDAILLRVINGQNLEEDPDFKPHFSLVGWFLGAFQHKTAADPADVPLQDAPQRRERMLSLFRTRESVRIVSGTRIIAVSFLNRNPKVAASVANDLVRELSEYTFQTKFAATNEASIWLERQLGDLRKQSTDLQAKVSELQRQTGLYGVGGAGPESKAAIYSPILDRFQQSNGALAQAESNLLIKGAVARVAQTGDADQISQLSGTGLMASTGVQSSLQLIESLRTQEATLQQQIGKDATIFGPSYPRLIEENASLAKIQLSLKEEIARVSERAQNDYNIAQLTERGFRRRFEEDKEAAAKLNDRTIEYALLAKEADQSQLLYNDLLRRLREAGILEGLRSSNISSVGEALAPASPATPNVKLLILAGPLVGLLLGIGAAFLFDSIDNKVRGPDEIEAEDIPLLGILPSFTPQVSTLPKLSSPTAKDKRKPVFLTEPTSPYSEALRALRSSLLIASGSIPPQVILITSGSPGEGKSTLAMNLALALAQFNREVLLVEIDLRRPVLSESFGLSRTEGLSRVLSDPERPIYYETYEGQPHLKIIPAGPRAPFPGELLASPRLDELIAEWRQQFTYILLDAPPVLPIADAQSMVEKADFTLMVVRSDRTSRISMRRAYRILLRHQIKTTSATAAVLNALSLRSASYYGYYGYYGGYEYSETNKS
jgi:succinoglycan biosynthesis transport protein ExoP